MPFLPTKIHEDKFDSQGTAQGLFTIHKLQVLIDTLLLYIQVTQKCYTGTCLALVWKYIFFKKRCTQFGDDINKFKNTYLSKLLLHCTVRFRLILQ